MPKGPYQIFFEKIAETFNIICFKREYLIDSFKYSQMIRQQSYLLNNILTKPLPHIPFTMDEFAELTQVEVSDNDSLNSICEYRCSLSIEILKSNNDDAIIELLKELDMIVEKLWAYSDRSKADLVAFRDACKKKYKDIYEDIGPDDISPDDIRTLKELERVDYLFRNSGLRELCHVLYENENYLKNNSTYPNIKKASDFIRTSSPNMIHHEILFEISSLYNKYAELEEDDNRVAVTKISEPKALSLPEHYGYGSNKFGGLPELAVYVQETGLEIPTEYFVININNNTLVTPFFGPYLAMLNEKSPEFSKLFIELIKRFDRISSTGAGANEVQRRSFTEFFPRHFICIDLLVEIMGEKAFTWLVGQIGPTVLPLERLLSNLPYELPESIMLLLRNFFESHDSMLQDRLQMLSWQSVLLSLESICVINKAVGKEVDYDALAVMFQGDLNEVVHKLSKYLMRMVLDLLDVSKELKEEVDVDAFFRKVPPQQFALLVKAKASLTASRSPFVSIFDGLINKFLAQQDVDQFIHGEDSQVGRHNASIRTRLKELGVNPEVALAYNKKSTFKIGKGAVNQNVQLKAAGSVLDEYWVKLKKETSSLLPKVKDVKISMQLKSILKSLDALTNATSEKQKIDQITKINKNCIALLNSPSANDAIYNSFKEFAGHVVEQSKIIDGIKRQGPSSQATENFVIEQWDKRRVETLFLANEVECCLAAGSSQFPAMIQRIMDDAMLFHVVTEEQSQKPVALSWLYLAESSDGKVYVIANFLEIKARYGANESSRKIILDELLRFTGQQYCHDNPNIEGFLINELGYGWHKGKLSDFPVNEIQIVDKIGGPLLPSDDMSDNAKSYKTADVYYLQSLNRDKLLFHIYPTVGLEQSKRENATKTQDHPSISDNASISANLENLIKKQQTMKSALKAEPDKSSELQNDRSDNPRYQ